MDVKYMNPFILGCKEVIKQTMQIDLQLGSPYIRQEMTVNDSMAILIGLTDQIQGQVLITFPLNEALTIVSKMMGGMQISQLDDISISAISELGNMIMGHTATIFSNNGILTNITPPSILRGQIIINQTFGQTICIPLNSDDIHLSINVSIKDTA